jgi:hypothetical protein
MVCPERQCVEWIGLLGVTGPADNPHLSGCPGAYVTVVAMACSYDECMARLGEDVQAIGLRVEEVVWCETLEDRLAKYDIEGYLLELAKATERDHRTRFGVFHAWESED